MVRTPVIPPLLAVILRQAEVLLGGEGEVPATIDRELEMEQYLSNCR